MENCSHFTNHRHHVLQTKEEGDHPACYQQTVQKSVSLMVWGCMSVHGLGSLHIWKGSINAEEYIEVSEQHLLPDNISFREGLP